MFVINNNNQQLINIILEMSYYSGGPEILLVFPTFFGIGALVIEPIRKDLPFSIIIGILTGIYTASFIYTFFKTRSKLPSLGIATMVISFLTLLIVVTLAYGKHKAEIDGDSKTTTTTSTTPTTITLL